MIRRFVAVPIALGLLVISAYGADDQKKVVKPPAAAKVAPPRPAPAPAGGNAAQPEDPQKQLERIMNMNPVVRQRWLESLPPQRRQNIERRLREYHDTPPAERNLATRRAAMLQSLPQQRQNQIKRSIKQFEEIPEERRLQLGQELGKMAPMSDEDRRAYMNTEEFRNKYSPTEQQIVGNISEVTPQVPPKN
jgi:hypothetical protein